MARVVAVSNQKGGVGKTTTSVNLAAALAMLQRRVLLIDLDPQGNASSGLGHRQEEVGVYDAMMGYRDVHSALMPTSLDTLQLLPATRALVGAELELVEENNRERLLRRMVNTIREDYDDVIIDCPPSLGLLTLNGLVAADAVLIPLQAEYYAMEGLGELLRTIGAVRKSLQPDLEREGILITMSDSRNNLCRAVESQARELFAEGVFETVIPRNVRLGEAPSHERSIHQYDPASSGAQSYMQLAKEILKRRERIQVKEAV